MGWLSLPFSCCLQSTPVLSHPLIYAPLLRHPFYLAPKTGMLPSIFLMSAAWIRTSWAGAW